MEKIKPKQIPLVKLPYIYKMVIPSDVDRKIQHLLTNVYNIEWSGVLFYTYKGTFEDGNLEIVCKDILLMDVGGAVSTEFDMSPDVIAYMTENPELLDCQMGLLHSHHSFQTFFSSTDNNTLLEEGKDRNNFVSLIVNNAGTYNAAITRKVKYKKDIYQTNTYEYFDAGEKTSFSDYSEDGEEVQYFHLNVERDIDKSSLQILSDRLTEIRNKNGDTIPVISKETSDSKKKYTSVPSLFGDYNPYPTVTGIPNKGRRIENQSDSIHFNKDTIHSLVAQIVTGCVTINEKKLGDLKKLNMEAIYKRRFGSSTTEKFKAYVDTILEYLLWYTDDEGIPLEYDEEVFIAALAEDILNKLDELPNNEYLQVFKVKLFNYMIII